MIRSCCGQDHHGLVCPDGLVMCCLCHRRVPVSELNEPTSGFPEDVCKTCAIDEEEQWLVQIELKGLYGIVDRDDAQQ